MIGVFPPLLMMMGAGGFVIPYSADFSAAGSGKLTRVAGAPVDEDKFSLLFWIKFDRAGENEILGTDTSTTFHLTKNASEKLQIWAAGSSKFESVSTFAIDVFYHCALAVDLANVTVADRLRLYISGTRDGASASGLSSGDSLGFNKSGGNVLIGYYPDGGGGTTDYHDGRLAEFVLLDGVAITDPIAQGWLGASGEPIDISGNTFGAGNSFYLPFTNPAALGTDASGNGNNLTVSGTVNQSTDVPV